MTSKGRVYSAYIAKAVPTDWCNIKFYNDFGLMTPNIDDDNSMQNVLGAAISVGPA